MIYVKPGSASGLILTLISLLSRKTFKRNIFPIWAFSTSSKRVLGSSIRIFSAAITRSPLLNPAFSAGLFGITDCIKAPVLSGNWTIALGSSLCCLAILGFNLTISLTSSERISRSSNKDIFTTSSVLVSRSGSVLLVRSSFCNSNKSWILINRSPSGFLCLVSHC